MLVLLLANSGGLRVRTAQAATVIGTATDDAHDDNDNDNDGDAAAAASSSSASSLHLEDDDSSNNNNNNDDDILEYDAGILDPHSVHGSPYGGFGRATASRLAALPLLLPPVSEEQLLLRRQQQQSNNSNNSDDNDHDSDDNDDNDNTIYAQVRDATGKLFACRVYLEDELDPASWSDGLFAPPRLARNVKKDGDLQQQQQQQLAQETTTTQTAATTTTTSSAATSRTETAAAAGSSGGGDPSRLVRSTTTAQQGTGGDSETAARGAGGGARKNAMPADDSHQEEDTTSSTEQRQQQQQRRRPDTGADVVSTPTAADAAAAAGVGVRVRVPVNDPAMAFAPVGARRAAAEAAEAAAPAPAGTADEAAAAADDDDDDPERVRSSYGDDEKHGDADTADRPKHRHHTTEQKALIRAQLAELEGICGQIHRGYWSYEWCFEKGITQYHIEYNAATNAVQVEQVTHLGTFQSRRYHIDDLPELPPNEFAEDYPELARVVDHHTRDGDLCQATGRPRQSHVHLQCCSGRVLARRRGMLHRDGHPLPSSTDIAALWDVREEETPDKVCVYNVTVCTPLLCGEAADEPEGADSAATAGKREWKEKVGGQDGGSSSNNANANTQDDDDPGSVVRKEILSVLNALSDTTVNEGETFRSILDRTLANLCLQTNSGGWWVYEYCHKEQIRQFHEVTAMRKSASAKAAIPARVVETEHILGRYNPVEVALEEDDITGGDDGLEWKLVVNATAEKNKNVYGDGNGAYYEIEYTGGDVCDHTDVTESAVVAGGTGAEAGGLERASTVRFYCGKDFGITVNEDHTCHYIVTVLVPALCGHPLFRAPISKRQIMKCLPVEED